MSSAVYGYVRVSTQCQHEDRQMIAIEEMDVPKLTEISAIFIDSTQII